MLASETERAISLMLADISPVPMATVWTDLFTCSAETDTALAWVEVSLAFLAMTWERLVNFWAATVTWLEVLRTRSSRWRPGYR